MPTTSRRQRLAPKPWPGSPIPVPFSQGWRVGDLLFIGAQASMGPGPFDKSSVIGPGDIEVQTRTTFNYITKLLHEAGADWKHVVKLNTYYDDRSEGNQLVEFWKKMTNVRLEFLQDPGPCGTAIRVGLPYPGLLIAAEAIAFLGDPNDRVRLMPKPWWEWPIQVPLSQGWRAGNIVFLGGQVSMNERGEVVGPGDIEVQTRTVFEYLTRLLHETGADWKDVVKLNTFFDFAGAGDSVLEFWKKLTRVRLEFLRAPGPGGTAVRAGFGAAGLLIEVEGIAVLKVKSSD